jgi:hypothetical protein
MLCREIFVLIYVRKYPLHMKNPGGLGGIIFFKANKEEASKGKG